MDKTTTRSRLFRTALWALLGFAMLARASLHPVWLSRAAKRTGEFCSHTLYLSFIVAAAVLLLRHGQTQGAKIVRWWPAMIGLLTFACVELLKRLTGLPRPDGAPTGFPSGHTTFAFGLAWLLAQAYPRFALLWFTVAVCIGWARMEGLAHFPYQVLCGAVLGTILGGAVSHGFWRHRALA